jgi:hypothetical protein
MRTVRALTRLWEAESTDKEVAESRLRKPCMGVIKDLSSPEWPLINVSALIEAMNP